MFYHRNPFIITVGATGFEPVTLCFVSSVARAQIQFHSGDYN